MNDVNEKLISRLKSNVTKKLNNQNEMIDTNNLYGVFIGGNHNKFIICKECDLEEPFLREIFTGEYIEYSEVRLGNVICPWKKTDISLSWHFNALVFYLPITKLINIKNKDGRVSKTELSNLYSIVNEYLRKNSEFIGKIISNEKIKCL